MFAAMAHERRIAILDKSVLAGNLYKLLFAPLGAALVTRRRPEELGGVLSGRQRIDLAIINSNAFGRKFEEVESMLAKGGRAPAATIFILQEGEVTGELGRRAGRVPGARVIERPFHPDEFLSLVREMMGGGG